MNPLRETTAMERVRDLQAEIGATLDRFHTAGMSADDIVALLNAEVVLWESRELPACTCREDQQ